MVDGVAWADLRANVRRAREAEDLGSPAPRLIEEAAGAIEETADGLPSGDPRARSLRDTALVLRSALRHADAWSRLQLLRFVEDTLTE